MMWAELETGRPKHSGLSEVTFNPSKKPLRLPRKESVCLCEFVKEKCFFYHEMFVILVDLLSCINPEWSSGLNKSC